MLSKDALKAAIKKQREGDEANAWSAMTHDPDRDELDMLPQQREYRRLLKANDEAFRTAKTRIG